MTSDTPEPQDPARFSKAKSEPPILDLQAEKPESAAGASTSKPEQPKPDPVRMAKQPSRKLPIGGFVGGLIGGGLVALCVIAYDRIANTIPTKLESLQANLSDKADSANVMALDKRIAEIEAGLSDAKAALALATKKTATPDADLVKRIAALEAAIPSLEKNASQIVGKPDERALRLALILALRDAVCNDLAASREIAALEKAGESSTAFAALKSNLATPLVPFDEIRAEIMTRTKSAASDETAQPEQIGSASRVSSFFAQLVTVRPAGPTAKVITPDTVYVPLLDAVDQDDAKAALAAFMNLPEADRDKFKTVESELKRRVAVDTAMLQLLAESLDAIAKGDAP